MPELPTGTITLLFTDIEGSTHLVQQVGDHYAALLEECRQLLRTAFGQWHGQEVDTQGDAFFVVFARASDAVCAAVDIQRPCRSLLAPGRNSAGTHRAAYRRTAALRRGLYRAGCSPRSAHHGSRAWWADPALPGNER